MKRFNLVILLGIMIGFLIGCGTSDDKGAETSGEIMEEEQREGEVERASVGGFTIAFRDQLNAEAESGPVHVTMDRLQVNQLKVADDHKDVFQNKEDATVFIFHLEVENNADETVLFFPNGAILTTDTGEQVEADKLLSELVGDPIQTGKVKEGNIVFLLDTPAEEINEISVQFEGAKNESGEQIGDPIEMVFSLKE